MQKSKSDNYKSIMMKPNIKEIEKKFEEIKNNFDEIKNDLDDVKNDYACFGQKVEKLQRDSIICSALIIFIAFVSFGVILVLFWEADAIWTRIENLEETAEITFETLRMHRDHIDNP